MNSTLGLLILLCICLYDRVMGNVNPVSVHYPVEAHHSLHPPLDHSQIYWNYGGSTVLTKKSVRLTPATQGRQGWMWNEYGIDSENFEVELKMEIHSLPHFGGDGMGIWFVAPIPGANTLTDPEAISGPIFGMSRNFKGIGVIFDTYDNDGKRNNPAVYVLRNDGSNYEFSHDNDFEDEMLKSTPANSDISHPSHKCMAEFRNVNRPIKALIKFLNNVLYVYLDTEDGQGWRFCLGVDVPKIDGELRTLKDAHIALTSATGQVADNVDIYEVSTRYLRSSDTISQLAELEAMSNSSASGGFFGMLRFIAILLCFGLCALAVFEYQAYTTMLQNHIDAVAVVFKVNQQAYNQFYAHAALCVLLLLTMQLWTLLVNLPLLIIKYILHSKAALLVSPAMVTRIGASGNGILGLSPDNRYLITIGTLALTCVFYVYEFLFE